MASERMPSRGPGDRELLRVETKQELIDHCKNRSILLFASLGSKVGLETRMSGEKRIVLRSETAPHGHKGDDVLQELLNVVAGTPEHSFVPRRSGICVSKDLLGDLNKDLQDHQDEIRKISTFPLSRAFVCIDVSDFSKALPENQVLIVNSLNQLVREREWQHRPLSEGDIEAHLCIGDGYIYVLSDPFRAAYFGALLACEIEGRTATGALPVEFHFRMGVHYGPVYCFWDFGRDNWNYIGDGINGATRVLQAIGKDTDDVVYLSRDVRQIFLRELEQHNLVINIDGNSLQEVIRRNFENMGRKEDKHGNPWRVYRVNHTAISEFREHLG